MLADSIDISEGNTEDVRGSLAHILAFCGSPSKAIELTYKFIGSTLTLMINSLTGMAKLALKGL